LLFVSRSPSTSHLNAVSQQSGPDRPRGIARDLIRFIQEGAVVKIHNRRTILTLVAGASVASHATGATAFPADPIYAAIERHKATAAIVDAAVRSRSRFPDRHMNDEQQRQLIRLEEAIDDAWEPCEQAGIDLINTEPTTLAGIVAAIRYIQIQAHNYGAFMPHEVVFEFDDGSDGDGGTTKGWLDVFLGTVASATTALASEANA
jgi:hypothetical protein